MNMKQPILWCVAIMSLILAYAGHASFSGPYAVSNWSLFNSNANGFVDTTAAPARVGLTGGNNQSVQPGVTEWRINVPAAVTIQFDWSYATIDDTSGPWDRAGWRKNGQWVELVRNDSTTLNGRVSVNVEAGDTFAFWVRTEDNLVAPAELTITNFSTGPTPPAPLKFMCATISNQTVRVEFVTVPGRTYRVEGANQLPSVNWVQVGSNVTATASLTVVPVTTTNSPQRFFRAVQLP
jgi:hypothetical protein